MPGQRQTKQRALVFKAIAESKGPLTIDEIHTRVLESLPRTGIATIYRSVKLLLEAEWIRSVTLPTGETRYESAALGHHHHFQCKRCNRVLDVDHCPLRLSKGTELPGGYILHEHEITMYGVCPDCR